MDTALNFALEAATRPGPLEDGLSMVVLTATERERVLELLSGEQTGPGATARLKLRGAAPVADASWFRPKWSALARMFSRLFLITDGRERGRCRWCKSRARVDQYSLCSKCLPDRASTKFIGEKVWNTP